MRRQVRTTIEPQPWHVAPYLFLLPRFLVRCALARAIERLTKSLGLVLIPYIHLPNACIRAVTATSWTTMLRVPKLHSVQFLAFSEALGRSTSSFGSWDRASKFILWRANTIRGTVFAARHGLLPLKDTD
jgi:hypothetical protein